MTSKPPVCHVSTHQVVSRQTAYGTTLQTAPPARQDDAQSLANGGNVESTVTLTGDSPLEGGLEIDLTLDHLANSQLTATLSAPWPEDKTTSVTLFENLTSDSASLVTITFNDRGQALTQTIIQENALQTDYSLDVPKIIR